MTLRRLLLVIAGGMLGTAARLGIGLLIPNAGLLPVGTLVANVVGALLIGVLAARLPSPSDIRVFLGTGILGGFTTYSAFAVGSVQLWTDAPLLAVLYVVMTLGIGLAAAVLGMRWGKTKRRA